MGPWAKLLHRGRSLPSGQRERLERWRALPRPPLEAAPADARFIVADVETSGLDPRNDRLIAIGAVTVDQGKIALGRAFYRVLKQPAPSSRDNILVHGIGGAAQETGDDPIDALLAFLEFVGHAPLVGYHAAFDAGMIGRAMRDHLGLRFKPPWIDLAYLAPALIGATAGREKGLDAWLRHFGIEAFSRHDAVADSLATAQLLLAVLAHAQSPPERVDEILWDPAATGWLAPGR